MSDPAETIEHEAPPKPVKKRRMKRRRVQRRNADVVPFKNRDEFAGMTKIECCTACKPECCVISGAAYCAHPMMSGLQPTSDQIVIARYGRAKKVLQHQRIEDTDFL
jgi:hypothetical protein